MGSRVFRSTSRTSVKLSASQSIEFCNFATLQETGKCSSKAASLIGNMTGTFQTVETYLVL